MLRPAFILGALQFCFHLTRV